ncbi:glycosyltransferase family 4 protein [Candidatus Peregrinibacteria bacterium]|nr:glycosyltransferase family 4 protein [Candidatus Peregrinibacteria bacterium]
MFFAPTSFIIPAFLPRDKASVVTVHDLVAFLHPHLHQAKAVILEHLFLKMALKKTRLVLAPSKHTKNDLIKLFRFPAEKIAVTPLAAERDFFEQPSAAEIKAVKEKYSVPEDFILAVSGLEPRKNVKLLLDVFPKIIQKHPKTSLIIIGGTGWKSKKVRQQIQTMRHAVKHIRQCDARELRAFYRLARAFVYPSLYEGFGLPVLEAMAAGCPVLCSNASSLPEVAGQAALFFHPEDGNALEKALFRILEDEPLRRHLIAAGRMQAAKFSWEKTAALTLKNMERCCE